MKVQPKDMRFLTMEHYRLKCEAIHPGSYHNYYCPLCRMKVHYPSVRRLKGHFEEFHMLVAATYKCRKCEKEFALPSEYRSHVRVCDNDMAKKLLDTMDDYIMDACRDCIGLATASSFHSIFGRGDPRKSISDRTQNPVTDVITRKLVTIKQTERGKTYEETNSIFMETIGDRSLDEVII